jgi:hypothetical protein
MLATRTTVPCRARCCDARTLFFIGSKVIWQSARGVTEIGGQPDIGCESRLKDARAVMFAAVDRANLTVHSIEPRGLANIGPQTGAGAFGAQKGEESSGPRNRLQMQQKDMNDLMASQGTLRVLPDRTGGRRSWGGTIRAPGRTEAIAPVAMRVQILDAKGAPYAISRCRSLSRRSPIVARIASSRFGRQFAATRLPVEARGVVRWTQKRTRYVSRSSDWDPRVRAFPSCHRGHRAETPSARSGHDGREMIATRRRPRRSDGYVASAAPTTGSARAGRLRASARWRCCG